MKLLIDTCTWLWFGLGRADLSGAAKAAILNADNERYVSAASVWELSIKHAKGRLPLPYPPEQFLVRFLDKCAAEVLPIDELSALQAGKLPALHTDPFDRMLVAQSVLNGMAIVTPDPLITQYTVRTLW